MAAYILGLAAVHDPGGMAAYRQGVPATLARYGGRLLVRGRVESVLEGESPADSLVVFEFATAEDARRWYSSPDYAAIRGHREQSAESLILLLTAPALA